MKPNGIGIAGLGLMCVMSGCSFQKTRPFEMRADREGARGAGGTVAAPQKSEIATVSVGAASEGVNAVAVAGAPAGDAGAEASGPPVLIDQKVGEINGRAVRVKDILDEVGLGPRLAAWARTRKLNSEEWKLLTGHAAAKPDGQTITRDQWLQISGVMFTARLNRLLEDELLEAEARSTLKPEQKQGLAWLVQEAAQNLKRESAGSQVAADRRLRDAGGMTEEQFKRQQESGLLIWLKLDEQIRRRIHVSWKDVRLYYERNQAIFNPPPAARFRLIQAPAKDEAAVKAIQEALDKGEPFAQVAGLRENGYRRDEGGLMGEKEFKGEYATASFSLPQPLEEAAHTLRPGEFTKQPLDVGNDKMWICLDSVSQTSQSLSERDVQLRILLKLTTQAEELERQNYINHLKERASFSDMDTMVRTLVQAAAERYWPEK